MTLPAGTKEVARMLGCSESQLAYAIRKGQIDCPLVVGRRVWGPDEILKAEELGLGRLSEPMRAVVMANREAVSA